MISSLQLRRGAPALGALKLLGQTPSEASSTRSRSSCPATAVSRQKGLVCRGYSPGHWTIKEATTYEVEVKKSRFVATAWPISGTSEAQELIQSASDPDASHNCYAFKLGIRARSSDDGEPAGTAGRPILAAIEGDGLDGVCVLVTRYYGGIKLGAGGLMRAYGGAARDCLRSAPKAFVPKKVEVAISSPFEALGTVYNLVQKHSASTASEDYTAGGAVKLLVSVDVDKAEALCQAIANATSGRVTPAVRREPESE